ncbi:scavenger receptor cysteine-rich type 1 protein M130-like [Perca flavescens]|uniref:scavenger receptor cysteine-rich type 1 protein M130-like n=1 Tax=Perca flavescens TaxID=8167 RepID=UPI00106DDF4A|nr:scavenger receptor cysteine-rich type 1 protein M130-like [Perca flavescens]
MIEIKTKPVVSRLVGTKLFSSILFPSCQSAQCKTTAKADIVLLVDDSSSISPSTFKTIKNFLADIVSNFDIGPDRVQIGLVQYNHYPRTGWHLNTYKTKGSLLKAITNLEQQAGDTKIGRALNYTLKENFKPNVGMRADSKNIAVLITDGESNDDTLLPSMKLKRAGIEIYAIGVDHVNIGQLGSIVSYTAETHMYYVRESSNLWDIFKNFIINICNSINNLDSVRLVNGTSLCSGRLEVKTNQSTQRWSSVCEDDFDQQDAEVVCRELGCGAPSVLQGALYGEVEAPMRTKVFQCGGNESALLDCRSSGSDRNVTCAPGKAVGLNCSEPVRLVGGFSRCTGTVEVKRGDWRPVDVSDWTLKEAAVVCEELECGSPVSAGIRNESLSKSAWKISPNCIHSGYTLRECVTSGSSSSIMKITCLEPVRLVGGSSHCAGTLEAKRGDWRPVDVSDWTLKEAAK